MPPPEAVLSLATSPPEPFVPTPPRLVPWWIALVEVVMVSDVPTQILVMFALYAAGQPLPTDPHIPLQYFAMLSLFDTALVALLIRIFLALSGESSQTVFLGRRRSMREILLGLALVPAAFLLVTGLVYALRTFVPSLHTVDQNPLAAYMASPLDAAIFSLVVILAGGVREELSRAFILHRFGQSLGGVWVGLALFSVLFGALHFDQGLDVAVAVGVLGLLWGVLYIKRGSAVAPIACHAGFDVLQIVQATIARALTK